MAYLALIGLHCKRQSCGVETTLRQSKALKLQTCLDCLRLVVHDFITNTYILVVASIRLELDPHSQRVSTCQIL